MLYRRTQLRASVTIVVLAVLGAVAAVTFLIAPLNGNLRYEAGVKLVSTHSAAATFSHRPLGFRLVMDAVFSVADPRTLGVVAFELVVRVLLAAVAVGSGLLLWRGLRARAVPHAGWYGGVVVGSLILLGPISAGEPDWMAVAFAAAGVGVALLGRRRHWPYAILAGTLFVAAAAMKVVSLPTALLGLLAVALIDRRQALRTVIAATAVGLIYLAATLIWVPWEIQWLLDIGAVQNDAGDALPEATNYLTALVQKRPVLLLVPVALVLAGWRERLVTVAALAVCLAMILGQGQYFDYHAIPLVVVAAIAVFRGLLSLVGRIHRVALPAGALAGLICLALLYPGSTPWAAQLVRGAGPDNHRPPSTLESRDRKEAVAAEVHQVIGGAEVPVTYLTFGEWTYFLGNPTSCRYPSPLFLQRTRKPARLTTDSYRENVECLSDPASRWLVRDPSWFRLKPQPQEITAIIQREWDCDAVQQVGELLLCPRR